MIRTRVGYTGGRKAGPRYTDLGDHTESIQVEYDPSQVSFEQLLAVFWATHNPCEQADSRQYMSAVFCHDEAQTRLALEGRDRESARRQAAVVTAVLPLTKFYLAEAYHQKFKLRQEPDLLREFQAMYPDVGDLVSSTAAARVNGYLGGYGSDAQLRQEIDRFGLSQKGSKLLLELWQHRPKLLDGRACFLATPASGE